MACCPSAVGLRVVHFIFLVFYPNPVFISSPFFLTFTPGGRCSALVPARAFLIF